MLSLVFNLGDFNECVTIFKGDLEVIEEKETEFIYKLLVPEIFIKKYEEHKNGGNLDDLRLQGNKKHRLCKITKVSPVSENKQEDDIIFYRQVYIELVSEKKMRGNKR